jgi:hypothetical protein
MDASNIEIRNAAGIANAQEFIENDNLSTFDDAAESLIHYMEEFTE